MLGWQQIIPIICKSVTSYVGGKVLNLAHKEPCIFKIIFENPLKLHDILKSEVTCNNFSIFPAFNRFQFLWVRPDEILGFLL